MFSKLIRHKSYYSEEKVNRLSQNITNTIVTSKSTAVIVVFITANKMNIIVFHLLYSGNIDSGKSRYIERTVIQ